MYHHDQHEEDSDPVFISCSIQPLPRFPLSIGMHGGVVQQLPTTPPETSSTSNSTSPPTEDMKPGMSALARTINRNTPYARPNTRELMSSSKCLVCGDLAWNKHFGSLSCNACAAFFRRTVSRQKSYICRRGKNCALEGTEPRHMCRFCRFQRCIQSGMVISAVLAPLASQSPTSTDNFLKRLVLAKRANFVNRVRATVHAYGGHTNMIQMANKHKDCFTAGKAIYAETRVVKQFLDFCGIDGKYLRENVCVTTLMRNFFFSWVLCGINLESIFNTAKNAGFRTNQYYFIDESFLTINEDRLTLYYGTDSHLRHPESVARHATDYFKEVLQLAAKFHEARLDEEEQAALSIIMIITTATNLTRNRLLFDEQLKNTFQDLKTHYEETYDDIAIRMGNIVLLLQEFQRVRHLFLEHMVMQRLSGKVSNYQSLTERNENPLHKID